MRKKLILILNLYSIGLSACAIYGDYISKGKFHLIDYGLLQDGDGIGYNLFAVIIILLSLFSILHHLNFSFPFAKISNIIYGFFVLIIGLGLFLQMAGNAGNHEHVSPNPMPWIILFLILVGILVLNGLLILWDAWVRKSRTNKENSS